jgi:hypothetical protein
VSTRHAACSCEQLRLTVEGEPVRVSIICHCLACQRRTGSVFGVQARIVVPVGAFADPFLPCADEVGLGGAATFLVAASDDIEHVN